MSSFTAAEIAYLQSQRLGRLATADLDGQPHVVPVGFRYNLTWSGSRSEVRTMLESAPVWLAGRMQRTLRGGPSRRVRDARGRTPHGEE